MAPVGEFFHLFVWNQHGLWLTPAPCRLVRKGPNSPFQPHQLAGAGAKVSPSIEPDDWPSKLEIAIDTVERLTTIHNLWTYVYFEELPHPSSPPSPSLYSSPISPRNNLLGACNVNLNDVSTVNNSNEGSAGICIVIAISEQARRERGKYYMYYVYSLLKLPLQQGHFTCSIRDFSLLYQCAKLCSLQNWEILPSISGYTFYFHWYRGESSLAFLTVL